MKFELRHSFKFSISQIESAIVERDFLDFLVAKHPKIREVELLSEEKNGTSLKRRVHYKIEPAFAHIAGKPIPSHWFEFIEHSTWDGLKKTLSFENRPATEKLANRVTNQGTVSLRNIGDERTERITLGNLQVKLPLMMKPVAVVAENVIYKEATALLESEVRVLKDWLENTY